MSIGKLILYPCNAGYSPTENNSLISTLTEIGLIGQPMDSEENSFLTGERFLQLISFVGCSPNVCLTPEHDSGSGFSHLTIKGPFNPPKLVWDASCRPPRCPACKGAITYWKTSGDKTKIECRQCGEAARPEDIALGRRAGYGRIFIEINNVFPGEAQPVDELLDILRKVTDVKWDYFFTG